MADNGRPRPARRRPTAATAQARAGDQQAAWSVMRYVWAASILAGLSFISLASMDQLLPISADKPAAGAGIAGDLSPATREGVDDRLHAALAHFRSFGYIADFFALIAIVYPATAGRPNSLRDPTYARLAMGVTICAALRAVLYIVHADELRPIRRMWHIINLGGMAAACGYGLILANIQITVFTDMLRCSHKVAGILVDELLGLFGAPVSLVDFIFQQTSFFHLACAALCLFAPSTVSHFVLHEDAAAAEKLGTFLWRSLGVTHLLVAIWSFALREESKKSVQTVAWKKLIKELDDLCKGCIAVLLLKDLNFKPAQGMMCLWTVQMVVLYLAQLCMPANDD